MEKDDSKYIVPFEDELFFIPHLRWNELLNVTYPSVTYSQPASIRGSCILGSSDVEPLRIQTINSQLCIVWAPVLHISFSSNDVTTNEDDTGKVNGIYRKVEPRSEIIPHWIINPDGNLAYPSIFLQGNDL